MKKKNRKDLQNKQLIGMKVIIYRYIDDKPITGTILSNKEYFKIKGDWLERFQRSEPFYGVLFDENVWHINDEEHSKSERRTDTFTEKEVLEMIDDYNKKSISEVEDII